MKGDTSLDHSSLDLKGFAKSLHHLVSMELHTCKVMQAMYISAPADAKKGPQPPASLLLPEMPLPATNGAQLLRLQDL